MARSDDPLDVLTHAARAERAELVRRARAEGLQAEDALDCVHDAFCTFFRLAQKGDLPPEADDRRAFLRGIVRNAARNRRRRHYLSRRHEEIAALDASVSADVDGGLEPLLERAERHVRVRACVDRLCETQRAVVTLRLLDERTGEDVAAALGLSRGYVDVLLHRAKHALRACLAG